MIDLQTANKKGNEQAEAAEGADNPKRKNGTPYYMAPELFTEEGVFSF